MKISGEALGGEKGSGFDEQAMDAICTGVQKAHALGVQIGIVVGGGNFWRGRSSGKMERTLADKIGMLATVMNALAVSDKLEQLGVPTEVFTSISMPRWRLPLPARTPCVRWSRARSLCLAAVPATPSSPRIRPALCGLWRCRLRSCSRLRWWMASTTRYHKYPDAKRYESLTFTKVLEDQLAVMDGTAATLCRDNKLPILVFDLADPDNIARAVQGEPVGTLVYEG